MTEVDTERLRSVLAERSLVLDRELGRDGMSVVYLARDVRHNRRVAVKILRPGVPAGAERFVREIETISPLVHPNIVPLFDSGVVDGVPYFVMPYIEGESLRHRLQREGRLDIAGAVAGAPGIVVVTSATVMPSRLSSGLQDDSLDDPERLRLLAQETSAGTVISGSYFRSGDRISVQAEITDANDGTLRNAVGPVTFPVDRADNALDSLGRGVVAAIHRPPRPTN